MESKLKNSLERAKTYLSIVESIEKTHQFTKEEENWLFQNSRLLDEEMNELNFQQLEPAMSDAYRTYFKMEHPIATFPNYLKNFPMDERFILSALKNNLNGYIQKVEDLLRNPKKLRSISKEKKKKILRIIGFNKIKAILAEGNYTEDPLDTFGGYGVVEISNLQDLLKSLCFGGFAHHVAATLNKVGDIVEEALSKYLDYNIYFHNKEI